jgi:hypothetical protein
MYLEDTSLKALCNRQSSKYSVIGHVASGSEVLISFLTF